MNDFTKKYYRIGDVAEIVGVSEATLRYWETRFASIKPRRNNRGTRFYTPEDIEKIRIVHFLTKTKGLHIDAAVEHLRANADGLDRRAAAAATLREVRDRIQSLLDALPPRDKETP